MSHNEDQPPERNDPTPPDNAQKVNNCKKKKEESVKKENDVRRKLSEISAPKRRKILDKMMKKYHRDPFYQPIDIAKKILKKLKVSNTQYFMGRIRQDMEKWIEENVTISDEDNADSKKKVLEEVQQRKDNIFAATNVGKAKEKANPEAVAEQAGPSEVTKKVQHRETKHPTSNRNVQESSGSSSTAVEVQKEVPVIDLTIDLKMEIKKEVVTIDEDLSSASNAKEAKNATSSTPGNLPVMPYPMIGYNPNGFYYPEGFYPYYPNPYHNPMYNPYMFPPYDYQYPYNPYFYNPPCNSDFLPNYPVDHDSTQEPNLVNSVVDTQMNNSNISLPKDADKSTGTDAEKTVGAGESEKKQ